MVNMDTLPRGLRSGSVLAVGLTLAVLVYLPLPRSGELKGAFGEAKGQMKQSGVQIGFWAAMA